MPSGSSKSSKPKPAEVAAETKKHYTPLIKKTYPGTVCSNLYPVPLAYELVPRMEPATLPPPVFSEPRDLPDELRSSCLLGARPANYHADPVDFALQWAASGTPVPLICPANDKRPGGDWDTGVVGYEERLCRRSTLAAAMATPAQDCVYPDHYPIPITGVIFSTSVGT